MKPIRVIHLGPGGANGKGGMGRVLMYLIAELERQDTAPVECRVIDTYGPGPFLLMPIWFVAALARLAALAATGRADIVHVHMASYGSVLRKGLLLRLALLLGRPAVLHLHGADFIEFHDRLPAWMRPIVVALFRKATRVVVLGEYWREYVVGTLGVEAGRVVVIHNGVPAPMRENRPTHAAPRPCRMLALGELGVRKGTPEILVALDHPDMASRDWTAVIAGNGPVAQYRDEVARRGLDDRVSLPGWLNSQDVWRELNDCDIFLLPSRQEGLPVAILEAMAARVAIVTTPVGAITDAIEDEATGLLVRPGDADGLRAALLRLLDSPPLRERLAAAARSRFERLFSIEAMARDTVALYRSLCRPALSPT